MQNLTLNAEICFDLAINVDDDGELISGLWYVGVALSIFSSITTNLGVNIQKYSLTREIKRVYLERTEKNDEEVSEQVYICQPIWLIGLGLIILGAVGDFSALGFAAQSLATAVGGFTLVANIFFGYFLLKEDLTLRDVFATVLILIGVVLVAVAGDKAEKTFNLECLIELYKRKAFIIYISVVAAILLILFIMARILSRLYEESRLTPLKHPLYKRFQRIHPIVPTALSGILGSQSVLFAKTTAELLKTSLTEENELNDYQTYLIIAAMIVTIFGQLHWLAHSLRMFDAVLVVPLFQVFFITGGVVGGGVFFDEFSNLSQTEDIIFGCGFGLIIIGVYILSLRKHEEDQIILQEDFTPTQAANAELKLRVGARLSRDVRSNSFLGIGFAYRPASSRRVDREFLFGSSDSHNLNEPASLPVGVKNSRSASAASANSLPTPIPVAQFAISDAFSGIKQKIVGKRGVSTMLQEPVTPEATDAETQTSSKKRKATAAKEDSIEKKE